MRQVARQQVARKQVARQQVARQQVESEAYITEFRKKHYCIYSCCFLTLELQYKKSNILVLWLLASC